MASALLAPVQRYQGVQKESAGYKLLSSMGWKEGDGLGATGQGIKEHIRVKKKFENWGVGAVESADRARDWSAGMLDFHRVLSNLSEVTSQHATSGDSSDGSGSESDAEEAPAAEATPAPAKPAPPKFAPPKPAPKSVSHQGRFKRRESAKDVRQYTSDSLQAILGGVDPFAALAAAQARPEEVERPSAARSADAAPAPQADGRPPVAPRTVKWKKLTLQVLQGCGKPSMRQSKLVKAVAAAAGVDCKGADVATAVAGAIAGSRRLCQGSDGRVSLA